MSEAEVTIIPFIRKYNLDYLRAIRLQEMKVKREIKYLRITIDRNYYER